MYDSNVKLLIEVLGAFGSIALAAIPIVSAYIVAFIKRHTTAQTLATAISIGHIVVKATEQVAGATNVTGSQKYLIALNHAKDLAAHLHIDFSDDQWRGLIEQAVHELNANLYEPLVADAAIAPNVASTPPGVFVTATGAQLTPVQASPLMQATSINGVPTLTT